MSLGQGGQAHHDCGAKDGQTHAALVDCARRSDDAVSARVKWATDDARGLRHNSAARWLLVVCAC